jgi:hypothetical protein
MTAGRDGGDGVLPGAPVVGCLAVHGGLKVHEQAVLGG